MNRKMRIAFLSVVFLVLFWFAAVDKSVFAYDCPDCGVQGVVFQWRILAIPVYERRQDYDSSIRQIAEDLGIECKHPRMERAHLCHYWGLLFCAYPCWHGMLGVNGDNWYDARAKAVVQEMVRINPALRDEFFTNAMMSHDLKYIKRFGGEIRRRRDGNQDP